jgi:hypothetical protein
MLQTGEQFHAHYPPTLNVVPPVVLRVGQNASSFLVDPIAARRAEMTRNMPMEPWLESPRRRGVPTPDVFRLIGVRGEPCGGTHECGAPQARTPVQLIVEHGEVNHQIEIVEVGSQVSHNERAVSPAPKLTCGLRDLRRLLLFAEGVAQTPRGKAAPRSQKYTPGLPCATTRRRTHCV